LQQMDTARGVEYTHCLMAVGEHTALRQGSNSTGKGFTASSLHRIEHHPPSKHRGSGSQAAARCSQGSSAEVGGCTAATTARTRGGAGRGRTGAREWRARGWRPRAFLRELCELWAASVGLGCDACNASNDRTESSAAGDSSGNRGIETVHWQWAADSEQSTFNYTDAGPTPG
jgi:hypothetical protein